MATAIVSKRVAELYNLKLKNAFFVGVTSPITAISKTIEGLAAMKAEILQGQVDFVIVNTDGLVSGDIAVRYKADLVKALKPDVVVALQMQDELAPLIASLEMPAIVVEPSFALKQRTPEKRKTLREMTYYTLPQKSKTAMLPKKPNNNRTQKRHSKKPGTRKRHPRRLIWSRNKVFRNRRSSRG